MLLSRWRLWERWEEGLTKWFNQTATNIFHMCVCVPHILLAALDPVVCLPTVAPAPAAPPWLLILKPEAAPPQACNSYHNQLTSESRRQRTCASSSCRHVTSRQGSDACRRETAVGWWSSPGPSSAGGTHSDFASSAETQPKSGNGDRTAEVFHLCPELLIIKFCGVIND